MPTNEDRIRWDSIMRAVMETANPTQREMWLSNLELADVRANKVTVRITDPNPMISNVIKSRYAQMLDILVMNTFGSNYRFELVTNTAPIDTPRPENSLNPKYTFENFIQGDSNKFAFAAAVAVAEMPGEAYNPLFIYGNVGLGKTHLMNAIGNYALANNPGLRIKFITSENMANELIERLRTRNGSMDEFRSSMRDVDILMVDDIQFLSKTNATQEEFFNTFNELHQHGKQIVVSSDRPPKELPAIEDRLRSRFEWGLTVDIKKPNFETRMAILRNKAGEEQLDVGADVLEYIGRTCTSSIRALEGALNRLSAHSKMLHVPITMEMAQQELEGLVTTPQRDITTKTILQQVAEFYGITAEELRGKKRTADIAQARHVAIYLCRQLTEKSTTFIGQEFGGRDHTTVMSAISKIDKAVKNGEEIASVVRSLEEKIKGM